MSFDANCHRIVVKKGLKPYRLPGIHPYCGTVLFKTRRAAIYASRRLCSIPFSFSPVTNLYRSLLFLKTSYNAPCSVELKAKVVFSGIRKVVTTDILHKLQTSPPACRIKQQLSVEFFSETLQTPLVQQ